MKSAQRNYDIDDIVSKQTKLRRLVDLHIIYGKNENKLYSSGHLLDDFMVNCTWKGWDCKTG